MSRLSEGRATPRRFYSPSTRRGSNFDVKEILLAIITDTSQWLSDSRLKTPPTEKDGFYCQVWQDLCQNLVRFSEQSIGKLRQTRFGLHMVSFQHGTSTMDDATQRSMIRLAGALDNIRSIGGQAAAEMIRKGHAECLKSSLELLEEIHSLASTLREQVLEEEQADWGTIGIGVIPEAVDDGVSQKSSFEDGSGLLKAANPPPQPG